MHKLLITGDESSKLYWIDKLSKQNLLDVKLTLDCEDKDINIIFGHEKNIFSLNLNKYQDLKWIQLLSAGVSNPKNINIVNQKILTTSKGIHGRAMFEYIFYGLLHLNNKEAFACSNFMSWERHRRNLTFTDNQTILLVGCGNIGSYLAGCFNSLGLSVHACVNNLRSINNVDKVFDNLENTDLKQYDFIISSLPFTYQTENFFDSQFFSSLSPNAVFVNIGRGETVDELALERALSTLAIKGAILDTFSCEPVLFDNFKLNGYSNCICTPHISGFFNQSHDSFLRKFVKDYKLFLKDRLRSDSNDKY